MMVFLSLTAWSQNNNYSNEWLEVTRLEKKGLVQDATRLVNSIYSKAVKDNNQPQQVKSVMYLMAYRNRVSEDAIPSNIVFIDSVIRKTALPARLILLSMQAEVLANYLQQNRFRFYKRTDIPSERLEDIRTWSLERLSARITELYRLSLSDKALLQRTPVANFAEVIEKGQNTEGLRPMLYDLLIHRAIDWLSSEDHITSAPVTRFIMNDPLFFSKPEVFAKMRIESDDTASLHLEALKLYQELLAYQIKVKNTAGLIDADLKRLKFVHSNSSLPGKDKLYENALKQIEVSYPGSARTAEAMYQRAQLYYQGLHDQDVSAEKITAALAILQKILSEYPKTNTAVKAEDLNRSINRPQLEVRSETVVIPGQPSKGWVRAANIKKLYFKLIPVSRAEIREFQDHGAEIADIEKIIKRGGTTGSVELPGAEDHLNHTYEFMIPTARKGSYFLVTSSQPDFRISGGFITIAPYYISNIAYISGSDSRFFVMNRNTGEAIPSATVNVFSKRYDYQQRRRIETRVGSFKTNNEGFVKLPGFSKTDNNLSYQVISGDDELFTDDEHYYYSYNERSEKVRKEGFIYTDRSIYRPGQNVHFKTILINRAGSSSEVLKMTPSRMILMDANYQQVAAANLVTNEYGSYHGVFTLPATGLTGQFVLRDTLTNAQVFINVEEYKRPRFKVELEKPTGDYKLNDSILITGNAEALAGNSISNAYVNYRVVRQVRFPLWGYGLRIWPPIGRTESQEIANGTTVTDSEGKFKITFKALPDESIDRKFNPVFHYEVYADVTDINGETRSSNSNVAVGYKPVTLNVDLDKQISTAENLVIEVRTTNLNGVPLRSNLSVIIEKLDVPGKVFRPRYWEDPEFQTIDSIQHSRLFPYDPYRNEHRPENWKVERTIHTRNSSTNNEGSFKDSLSLLKEGWYRIRVKATSTSGDTIESVEFFEVTGDRTSQPLISGLSSASARPGENLKVSVMTGFDKLRVIRNIYRMDDKHDQDIRVIAANSPYSSSLNISESDRGGIIIENIGVKHNRFYRTVDQIAVPWKNKELQISFETFRDKTLPGAQETITLKISGENGRKVSAELLAAMYDASLDQFKPHSWNNLMTIWPGLTLRNQWNTSNFSAENSRPYSIQEGRERDLKPESYDRLVNNGWSLQNYYMAEVALAGRANGITVQSRNKQMNAEESAMDMNAAPPAVPDSAPAPPLPTTPSFDNVSLRKDFSETAFFLPEIKTDANGELSFTYTIPEALTQWKFMALTHTPDLKSGYTEKTVITRKQLMVQPNYPRFLTEGDAMELPVKIVSMEEQELTGVVHLELLDAGTNKPVDGWLKNVFPSQYFTVPAKGSVVVKFPLTAPENFNSALTFRIKAITTKPEGLNFSDGEELSIPVLSRRILVTESLPLTLKGTSGKTFEFKKLLESGHSETLLHKGLTVEYTSNPVWYVVQALPYLAQYPYDCSEQIFNRLYANMLASNIGARMPRLREVITRWNVQDTAALVSNLYKNQELKNILLEETPWLLDAKSESEQKRNIKELFNLIRISAETELNFKKLSDQQTPNGGFPWFKGGKDDRYITQYILTGFGRLLHTGSVPENELNRFMPMIRKALSYADARIAEEYAQIMKLKPDQRGTISGSAIQYLYMRSYFRDAIPSSARTAHAYFMEQAKQHWLNQSRYFQGMIALALNRSGQTTAANGIIRSLEQFAIKNEQGMYWKEMTEGGYYWHQAPIEIQSTLIEAFAEIQKNNTTVDELKTWLILNKQTNNWRTTRATADAVYAVLLNGTDWTQQNNPVNIRLGNRTVQPSSSEAGTGYFREVIPAEQVRPETGRIQVSTSGSAGASPGWGSVYWQYFEDADKVTGAKTPLSLVKSVYVETNGDRGPVLKKLENGNEISIGDKVVVRIELRTDRDMEYVHMKDMRAAALEPVNVLSGYRYQDGLGYYESTRDVSTSFFFDRLRKGTYVFEYSMFAQHAGNFSNGVASIECMYAPEFRSQSEGIRINVVERN